MQPLTVTNKLTNQSVSKTMNNKLPHTRQQKSANKINKCATNESYCIKKEKPVSFSTQPAVTYLYVLSFLIKINNCSSRNFLNNFTKQNGNTTMNTQNKSLSQQKSANKNNNIALFARLAFMRFRASFILNLGVCL